MYMEIWMKLWHAYIGSRQAYFDGDKQDLRIIAGLVVLKSSDI